MRSHQITVYDTSSPRRGFLFFRPTPSFKRGCAVSELTNAIQEFDSTYAEMFALVEQYPAELRTQSGACGTWSAREVLAHFSGWLVEVQRRYDGYDAGDSQKVQYDFDEFNARSVNARTGQ